MDKKAVLTGYEQELMRVLVNHMVACAKVMGFQVVSQMISSEDLNYPDSENRMVIEIANGDQYVLDLVFIWSDEKPLYTESIFIKSGLTKAKPFMMLAGDTKEIEEILDYLILHHP